MYLRTNAAEVQQNCDQLPKIKPDPTKLESHSKKCRSFVSVNASFTLTFV